jgi:hypothetical protein
MENDYIIKPAQIEINNDIEIKFSSGKKIKHFKIRIL